MPSVVERFFEVLSEIVPNYKEYLNPPCNPALFTEIENLIGEELPPAFKEFYRIADGEISNYIVVDGKGEFRPTLKLILGFQLASLSEIINAYNNRSYFGMLGDVKDFYSHNDFYYNNTCISSDADKIKTNLYFHRKWLPIAFNECCDSFLLDFAPAEKGVKGQIFVHNCAGDSEYWEEYASSFEEFVQIITNVLIEIKEQYKQIGYFWNNFDYYPLAKKSPKPFIDDVQKEKFSNLPLEWKDFFKNITPTMKNGVYCYDEYATLEQLGEIRQFWLFFVTKEQLDTQYNGILPMNKVMEDTYKTMLQDITPLILLPKIIEIKFWHEINLSQLDFVSQYLTQIYSIEIPNIFEQQDLKILGKFKRLFALHLNCGKIDDFSDLLSCKDLARITLNSTEILNLSALSELKELGFLHISNCPNIEDFSFLSQIKKYLRVDMTREQFLKAYKYMDKTKIIMYPLTNQEGTAEEKAIIGEWFSK